MKQILVILLLGIIFSLTVGVMDLTGAKANQIEAEISAQVARQNLINEDLAHENGVKARFREGFYRFAAGLAPYVAMIVQIILACVGVACAVFVLSMLSRTARYEVRAWQSWHKEELAPGVFLLTRTLPNGELDSRVYNVQQNTRGLLEEPREMSADDVFLERMRIASKIPEKPETILID